jgi:hypothetical protein
MPTELLELGTERYLLLAVAAGWGASLLLSVVLLLLRRRPLSILLWLGPAAMLLVGGAASIVAQVRLGIAMNAVEVAARDGTELLGLRRALSPLIVALWTTATGCVLSALCIALATIARPGPRGRFSPLHAGGAVIALLLTPLALSAGPAAFAIVVGGALAQGLVTLRFGRGRDARRMASARALVASFTVFSALALVLALPLAHRLDALTIWATLPVAEQDAALVGLGPIVQPITGTLGVAGVLVMTGFIGLLPVARHVVDARSAAGFVLSLLLMGTVVGGLVVPVMPLSRVERPDPAADRVAALASRGIVLPDARATAPWVTGTYLTVGLYWAHLDDERVLPFRDGRPGPPDDEDALDARLRDGLDGPLVIEADHRVDAPRLVPLLARAYALGHTQVCFVMADARGALGCQLVTLGEATDADHHLLVQPDELIHVHEEAQGVTLGAVGSLPGPLALHLHDELPMERLWPVLAQRTEPPVLVIRR